MSLWLGAASAGGRMVRCTGRLGVPSAKRATFIRPSRATSARRAGSAAFVEHGRGHARVRSRPYRFLKAAKVMVVAAVLMCVRSDVDAEYLVE
jgi:hypothetical protein